MLALSCGDLGGRVKEDKGEFRDGEGLGSTESSPCYPIKKSLSVHLDHLSFYIVVAVAVIIEDLAVQTPMKGVGAGEVVGL